MARHALRENARRDILREKNGGEGEISPENAMWVRKEGAHGGSDRDYVR